MTALAPILPTADTGAILQTLRTLVDPSDVVELRARVGGRWHSGYFDLPHWPDLATEAARLNADGGAVYVTLNPVAPPLLKRAPNRVTVAGEGTSTSNEDILQRRWLPFDFDPERPSGTSATEEQHAKALEKARLVRDGLTMMLGWPEPVLADSGNGAHLLYRIDLPNDEASARLVRDLLHAVAGWYSDSQVKVDKAVANSGRIWKLYGTVANKGAPTPETPWRLARILDAPEQPGIVTGEQLRQLVEILTPKAVPALAAAPATRVGDLADVPRIRDALARIDVGDHDSWLRAGMALKAWEESAPGAEGQGRALWEEWSTSDPDPAHHQPGERDTRWRSFNRRDGNGIGLGTLFHMAGMTREQQMPDPAKAFAELPVLPPGASTQPTGEAPAAAGDDDAGGRPSQSSMLVQFVGARADLFHDENKAVYVKDRQTGEVRALDSRQFKDWLAAEFYKATGKAARSQSVSEALGTLSGLGRYGAPCLPVHLRTARGSGEYFLDLAEPGRSRVVRIRAGAWEIVEAPGPMFLRPESMQPLPEPVRGGGIDPLWTVANVPEGARLLVLAWLVECLRPDTPYPVLELLGEQGSAKSTAQTAIRRLIDPNACDLRGAPKSVEDIFVTAGACALVSYENLSYLSGPMQDAFCVLATGGGHAGRKLYTDAEENIIRVKRPIVLNGIAAAITAQDLVDRAITVEPPNISDRREEEAPLWQRYEAERGRMLGALLDIAAKALELLPRMQIPPAERPRLLDFARLGMAVAAAVGCSPEDFLREFNSVRQESLARTIDVNPVATAVLTWLEKVPTGRTAAVGALMTELSMHRGGNMEVWPKTPKGFGDALRRAAPALRQMGVECRCLGKIGGAVRWEIKPNGK